MPSGSVWHCLVGAERTNGATATRPLSCSDGIGNATIEVSCKANATDRERGALMVARNAYVNELRVELTCATERVP